MGVTTNGEISFGFELGEEAKTPWKYDYDVDEEDWEFEDGDYEDWYYTCVKPFVPKIQVYTQEGNRIPGITEEQVNQHWEDKRKFKTENPMPFELVNTCSYDYPMYILAVPGSNMTCHRGYPVEFSPEDLQVKQEDLDKFMAFVKEFFPEFATQTPKWYLSSYYG